MISSKKEINQNQSFYMAEPKNDEHILSIVNGVLDRRLKDKSYYDVLPRTKFNDNEKLYFGTDKDFSLLFDGTDFVVDKGATNILHINYASNATTIEGGGVTGDDLILKCGVDAYPNIRFSGNGNVNVYTHGVIQFSVDVTSFLRFEHSDPDSQIITVNDKNLALLPNGTGKVKFGVEATNAGSDRGKLVNFLLADGTSVNIKTYDTV